MENMSLKIESVAKLVIFFGGLLAHYFWIKNAVSILNEKQKNSEEDIANLLKCQIQESHDLHNLDNRLTKIETCVTVIKRDIERIMK